MHFSYSQMLDFLYHDLQCGFHFIELYKSAEGFDIQYVKAGHLSMCSEARKTDYFMLFSFIAWELISIFLCVFNVQR